jgi:hypothetical protein
MDYRNDYSKLLDTLSGVICSNAGLPLQGDDDRFRYAAGLAYKFFDHATCVHHLTRQKTAHDFASGQLQYYHLGSVDVVVRAAFEAFGTLFYVFAAPKGAEEQDWRYWAWRAAGIAERQSLQVTTEEHREKLAMEKQELVEYRRKLQQNPAFQQLALQDRNRLLNDSKPEWRLKGWAAIAEEAGLTGFLARNFYRHLCAYSHSSSLSICQMMEALEKEEERVFLEGSINFMCILTANVVTAYAGLFVTARKFLETSPEKKALVDLWVGVGKLLAPDILSHPSGAL